ncbi:DUF4175 family protein [Acetobacter lambici]|uniref:DUF4175 domain-containing protein n=1 Tax=Acetobacter lambici TaxID=1332824 RepID=A0ABT1EWN1_9PROT|nr:DUF4175 family protein [Acetobacter lambici]MCP1243135.1 DUF4175 domain-containing protein [Acetobacter lambici]MCP1257367.1 DUF4175 domain-containing protein [Acetobacter lambici]NHO55854.1 DUF4175 family protein [Acetobacter lambici]
MGGLKHDLTASTAQDGTLAARLAHMRRHAALVLHIERLWPALQPTLAMLGGYTLAGLLRLPQHLSDGLRLVGVAGWLSLCGWRLHTDLGRLRPNTPEEVDRRIEQASSLHNRPLASLMDTPAPLPHTSSTVLWQAHRQRLLASLGHLRAGWPNLMPQGRARQLTAAGLVVALGIATGIAGPSAPGRVLAAFIPGRDDPDVPLPHIDAWITPPTYAPDAPVFLSAGHPVPQVLEGAHLTVIVNGMASHPVLQGSRGMVAQDAKRQKLDPHSWKLEVTLTHSGLLRLTGRARTIASWPITVLPDLAPQVAWGESPGATAKGDWHTRLPYTASHAYGLSDVKVVLHATHPARGANPKRELSIPLPLTGHPKSVKNVVAPDLSENPWAGQEVTGQIEATATSGHKGLSAPATFRLGGRVFHSPIARAILDVRRRFALEQEKREDTAQDLEALGEAPGPVHDHTGMFLNLTSIVALLDNADIDAQTARTSATNLLWDLALDIEDRRTGDNTSAQASIDVRAAQADVAQKLADMKRDGTHNQQAQEELEQSLKALQDAIARKMQALADAALRNHTAIPDLPGFSAAGNKAFDRLMKQLRSDAANGRSGDAMQRLQEMENATERMRNATPQDLAALAQQMLAQQKAREQAAALHDLTTKESSLLDHAQSRLDEHLRSLSQQQSDLADDGDGEAAEYANLPTSELLRRLGLSAPPDMGAPNTGPQPAPGATQPPAGMPDPAKAEAQATARRTERATQHALEQALSELKDEFKDLTGKTPDAFEQARKNMAAARKALADGDDAAAASAEEKALEALRQSRKQMQDSMKGNGQNTTPSFLPSFGNRGDGSSGSGNTGESGNGQPSDNAGENGDDENTTGKDPLGRKEGEGADQNTDDSTHIPDTVARQRAREIEQELRRRDSDRTRPQQELEYLDRLLKPF